MIIPKYFIQVEKDGDTFDAIEIKSMKSSESQLFLDVYQITVKNKHSSAVTAEISFKLVSDPTKIGDFLILAFK